MAALLPPASLDSAALLVTVAIGAATLSAALTWTALTRRVGGGKEAAGAPRPARLPPLPPATPLADGLVTITASPAPASKAGGGATIARPCSACATPPPAAADPTDPRPRTGYLSWDDYFMALAFLSAQRSKDPSKQVGACIVSPDRIILGIGYNGFPRGCPDDALPWAKRAPPAVGEEEGAVGGDGGACAQHARHRRRARRFPPGILGTKYPYVCHAEMNAILNKNATSLAGASMYVTMFPCNECSKLLIQAGIREVVFYEDKQANAEAPGAAVGGGGSGGGRGAAGVGGMAPAEAYSASRALLDLAGVAVRQHAPAEPLVLHVAPLPPGV